MLNASKHLKVLCIAKFYLSRAVENSYTNNFELAVSLSLSVKRSIILFDIITFLNDYILNGYFIILLRN